LKSHQLQKGKLGLERFWFGTRTNVFALTYNSIDVS
jgi:hypothetical protein